MKLLFLLVLAIMTLWCLPAHAAPLVKTGAKVLQETGYEALRGKKVGLITNHTGVVDDVHLIDLLHGSGKVCLAALFAPEHGLRGLEEDGVKIGEGVDERTGAPIFSLYGKMNKPVAGMLKDLDMLVFDTQDVGARFYTYISTMGLAMQAAAAAHVPFVVLDRPNPLGGEYFSGSVVKEGFISFVGQYPIPVTHGLTIGELALMIKGEMMLPGLENLDLRIVKMEGWQRGMQWPETGLPWIRTSPNVPDFETALLYAGICFLEATSFSEGRGTQEPFKVVGAPQVDSDRLIQNLNGKNLPGVRFERAVYTPKRLPGMSSNPKFRDRTIRGVRLVITDRRAYRAVETGIHLVSAFYGSLDPHGRKTFFKKDGFDQLAGTDSLRLAIQGDIAPEQIISGWETGLNQFAEKRKKYLVY